MKQTIIAVAVAAILMGCKSNSQNTGRPGEAGYSETGGSKAYYIEGANDRHKSKAGHSLHF